MQEPSDRPLVFLIEDDDDHRYLLGVFLTIAGFEAAEFDDAETALGAMERRTPAAVVTDIYLPGRDGYDVARAMRQEPRLARVPIIALTAITAESLRKEAELFDAVLFKPMERHSVIATLKRLLDASPARAARSHA